MTGALCYVQICESVRYSPAEQWNGSPPLNSAVRVVSRPLSS